MISNVNVYGLEESIKASGLPMSTTIGELSPNLIRAKNLGTTPSGEGHDCFLKGIVVQFDWRAPQYIWMQAERYHFFDIVSSQSKMHRITTMDIEEQCNEFVEKEYIDLFNILVEKYNKVTGKLSKSDMFQRVISNCPMGLELTARCTANYLQLKTMYFQRKGHKMLEWREFCTWCESLPMFKEIVLGE